MENPTGSKPNIVVEIASNRDLVLIVGPEETKLRVRSTLLMAASKPFFVVLGPDWKEGHNMHNQHEPLDDNATALKIVCSIKHHQNEKVPQTLAASDVLAIAVVTDKYICMNALKFASETWLRTFGSEPYNLMRLTVSACLFRSAQAFSEITRALVLEYDGSYLALRTDEVEFMEDILQVLQDLFAIWLTNESTGLPEEQRGFARLELSQILIAGGGTSSCCHNCGWTSKYAYAYMKLLETKGLWPGALSHISISKALEKAERMPDPVPEELSTQCQYAYKHEPPAYREHRHWKLDSLNKTIGLCLPCTRLERTDSNCSNPSQNR